MCLSCILISTTQLTKLVCSSGFIMDIHVFRYGNPEIKKTKTTMALLMKLYKWISCMIDVKRKCFNRYKKEKAPLINTKDCYLSRR